MFRTLKPYQLAIDISLASLCLLVRLAIGTSTISLLVVVFLMAGALALRRLSPALALAVLWVGVLVQLTSQLSPDIANASVIAVLYTSSRYGSNRVRWAGLASAIVGAFLAIVYFEVQSLGFLRGSLDTFSFTSGLPRTVVIFVIGLFSALALFCISWTLGLLARTRALARESRQAQNAAVASQEVAERDVAIEQERTRIARDMHDVVAHSLAVVIAQADGARYARAQNPDAVDGALTTISTTAREALADVRILLGQLRHSQGEAPQPVLADLDRLLDQLRGSGLIIRREESGSPGALGTGQQLAAYRIVQESLTNALRHSDTTKEVVVRFAWTPAELELTIANGLAEVAIDGKPGHGLDGMRERAVLAGGSLHAGQQDDRFVVTASLPVAAGEVGA